LKRTIIAAALKLQKRSDQRAQDQQRHELERCKIFTGHAKKEIKKSIVMAPGTLQARKDKRHNNGELLETFVRLQSDQRIPQHFITALQGKLSQPLRRFQQEITANLEYSRVSKISKSNSAIAGQPRAAVSN